MRTFMLLLMVFTMNMLSAQERTITGIVVDGTMGDDPLPGATISVLSGPNKKVSHGTVTDYDGKFTLKVDAKDNLFSVRFMGFETQDVKIVAGKNDYRVVLNTDDKLIGEVVVTGYQELDRRKLTSAVTTLKINEEKIGAVNNIDQALAGQIAGLSSITSPLVLQVHRLRFVYVVLPRSTVLRNLCGYSMVFLWRVPIFQTWRI